MSGPTPPVPSMAWQLAHFAAKSSPPLVGMSARSSVAVGAAALGWNGCDTATTTTTTLTAAPISSARITS